MTATDLALQPHQAFRAALGVLARVEGDPGAGSGSEGTKHLALQALALWGDGDEEGGGVGGAAAGAAGNGTGTATATDGGAGNSGDSSVDPPPPKPQPQPQPQPQLRRPQCLGALLKRANDAASAVADGKHLSLGGMYAGSSVEATKAMVSGLRAAVLSKLGPGWAPLGVLLEQWGEVNTKTDFEPF